MPDAAVVALFTTSFVVGLSGALMPGPVATVTIAESARQGFRVGPLITLGHALTEVVMVAALALGLSVVLQQPIIAGAIGLGGGLVLLWMGWGLVSSAWRGTVSLRLAASGNGHTDGKGLVGRLGLVPAGIVASLVNPYWLLWWATVGASYVVFGLKFGWLGVAAVFVGHILSDLSWNCLLSLAVASGRRFLSDRLYRGLLAICGLFLIGLSVAFVLYGAHMLRG
jgi:threonine/homoserine/homoserine lactone efflux protein